MNKLTKTLLVVGVGMIIWFIPVPSGLTVNAWHLLAIFVATILGFILQPLPIGGVAFIAITLAVVTQTIKIGEALSGFADTTIWLIVCAFLFAKGVIQSGLGKRIAFILIFSLLVCKSFPQDKKLLQKQLQNKDKPLKHCLMLQLQTKLFVKL